MPGELWAFPGYMPHCVLPRVVGPAATAAAPADEAQRRITVAVNVYRAGVVSTDGLSFMSSQADAIFTAQRHAAQVTAALRAHSG